MCKLKKTAMHVSQATSKFQFELLRALIVQTIVPICISYSPCLLCWYSPMFGVQLPRYNNFENIFRNLFPVLERLTISKSVHWESFHLLIRWQSFFVYHHFVKEFYTFGKIWKIPPILLHQHYQSQIQPTHDFFYFSRLTNSATVLNIIIR